MSGMSDASRDFAQLIRKAIAEDWPATTACSEMFKLEKRYDLTRAQADALHLPTHYLTDADIRARDRIYHDHMRAQLDAALLVLEQT